MNKQLSQILSAFFIGEGNLLLNCAKIFLERGHSIQGIISNDIKIKNWCVSVKIDCTSHKESIDFLEGKFSTGSVDILFSIVNDFLIPETIISKPTFAAINYHNSLLPTYAGINATTWAIFNQETIHGVSWHKMNSTIDSGDILKQKVIKINQTETAFTLNGKCYEAALESFQELIQDFENKQITITEQDLNFRSYFGRYKKPTPAGIINFTESSLKISALVRSLYFDIYPNEITTPKIIIDNNMYIVGNLSVTNHKSQLRPGSIINIAKDQIEIATSDNNVCITKLFDIQGKPINITQMGIDNLLQKGDIINNLSSDLLNQVSAVEQNIAKHEQYWTKQFENLNQIQLPYMKNLSTESGYHTMELSLPLTNFEVNIPLVTVELDKFLLGITVLFASKLSSSIDFGVSYSDPEIKDLLTFGQLFSTSLPINLTIEPLDSVGKNIRNIIQQINDNKSLKSFSNDIFYRYRNLQNNKAKYTLGVEINDQKDTPGTYHDNYLTISIYNNKFVRLIFDKSKFIIQDMKYIQAHYESFAANVLNNLDSTLNTLSVLEEPEKNKILYDWNNTQKQFQCNKLIHQLIEESANQYPDNIALSFCGGNLTYQDLNCFANRVAYYVRNSTFVNNKRVGVLMNRSPEMVISLLAILKAGYAYVPIDPEYPASRIEFIVKDSALKLILTQDEFKGLINQDSIDILTIDECIKLDSNNITNHIDNSTNLDDIAYIIYTSGSTGVPKGVMIPHKGILNRLLWMQQEFKLNTNDAVLQKTPFTFDVSVWELFWPLMFGARLVIAKPAGHKDVNYLTQIINNEQISVVHFVPSMLKIFLDSEKNAKFTKLRTVICSGEELPASTVSQFYQQLKQPNIFIYNLYGPTEASIDVTFYKCIREEQLTLIPIGKPISNTQIYILDKHMQPVPPGTPGILYIGGIGLATGYLNRNDLNSEKFINNPFETSHSSKLYNTGDLATFLEDGNINFIGRIDNQVKIRGLRIELGEIETALKTISGIKDAVTVVRKDDDIPRIVAYLIPESTTPITFNELRNYLLVRLPEYMVPSAFVTLDSLPLTHNGKLDHKALPKPSLSRPQMKEDYLEPTNYIEEMICIVWGEVLGIQGIGVQDNFFELGGDSMKMLQIISKLSQKNISLSVQSFFQNTTIQSLAKTVTDSDNTVIVENTPFSLVQEPSDFDKFTDDIIDAYPMSMLQKGMAFHYEHTPNSSFYQVVMTTKIKGVFDEELFSTALEGLILKHPTLRTVFDMVNYSEPLQLVYDHSKTILEIKDIRNYSEDEQVGLIEDYIKFESVRYFEWSKLPPFRVSVHLLQDNQFQFFLSYLDLVLDGWSASAFIVELFNSYTNKLKLETTTDLSAPQITYRHFVAYEKEAIASEKHKLFWGNNLENFNYSDIYKLPIPLNKIDFAKSDDYEVNFPVEIYEGIKLLSKKIALPIKHIILAGHIKLLNLLSSSDDIITGMVANGRLEFSDGERCLGNHLNTIPFRVNLTDKDMSWIELIHFIFHAEQNIIPYRRYPNSFLQLGSHNAQLYDVAFNFTYFHLFNKYQGQEICKIVEGKLTNPFHYAFSATFRVNEWQVHNSAILNDKIREERNQQIKKEKENNEFSDFMVALNYNDSKLSFEQIKQIGALYVDIFKSLLKDPSKSYKSSVLSDLKWNEVIEIANTISLKQRWRCIHHIIAEQSDKTPDKIAIIFNDQSYTYSELQSKANQFANYLINLGVKSGDNIGVCLDRSLEMVVALLGILKSGCAYVPIDPDFPEERKFFIVEDASINVLVTADKYISENFRSEKLNIIDVYVNKEQIEKESNSFNELILKESDTAYIIYTSGSTGKPKGVMIPHKGISNRLLWMQEEFKLNDSDVVLQKTQFTFDVSVWELFWPLMFGAKLIIAAPEGHKDNTYLKNTINKHGVTIIHFVPSMLRMFLEEPDINLGPISLKTVICSGEELLKNTADKFLEKLGNHVALYNLYGPTEASIDVTYHKVSANNKYNIIPIGNPISNTQIYILDRNLQPVPNGVPGILYIGGFGLATGYCNLPELTNEKFIPNPFTRDNNQRLYNTGDLACVLPNGEIHFLGRIDNQVKVRGFRIELGEIENILLQHSSIKEAVVQAKGDNLGNKKLIAYIVPNENITTLPLNEIRSFLAAVLPEYMVPTIYIKLENIPVTSNGKLDYKSLPNPANSQMQLKTHNFVEPRDEKEQLLCQIFARVLNIKHVGIHDNFFVIGGDSILAMQISAKLRQERVYISSNLIFKYPTIAELAALAQYNKANLIDFGSVEGTIPLAPIQARFFELNLTTINHWNASFAALVQEDVNVFLLEQALNTVFNYQDTFRIRFKQDGDKWIQYYSQSNHNHNFIYEDLSDLTHEEQSSKRDEIATTAHASLNITDGPLVSAIYFNCGGPNKDYILYIFHHLIIDGVSIRVVVEDINSVYRQLKVRQSIQLPAKTTSFKSFTEYLLKYSQTHEIESELEYWQNLPWYKIKNIPVDYDNGTLTELTSKSITLYLTEEETKELITIPTFYNVKLVDILVAALTASYKEVFGLDYLCLNLAHNGRAASEENMDLSRSLGWFQTLFPIVINANNSDKVVLLKEISDEIKKVPNNGMGYNLLKFVTPNKEIKNAMDHLFEPEISLNYLGQFNQDINDYTMCRLTGEGFGMRHGADCQISWNNILIRLFPIIINDKFKIVFNFSETSFKFDTINNLSIGFMDILRKFINHANNS